MRRSCSQMPLRHNDPLERTDPTRLLSSDSWCGAWRKTNKSSREMKKQHWCRQSLLLGEATINGDQSREGHRIDRELYHGFDPLSNEFIVENLQFSHVVTAEMRRKWSLSEPFTLQCWLFNCAMFVALMSRRGRDFNFFVRLNRFSSSTSIWLAALTVFLARASFRRHQSTVIF